MTSSSRPRPEPRLLRRDDAAYYAGVSATKFDELVADGRMPRPVRIDGRVLWDRWALDAKISDLGERAESLEFVA